MWTSCRKSPTAPTCTSISPSRRFGRGSPGRPRPARAREPRAPRPDLRLKALAALRQAGLQVGVFVMPVLPGITDREADLEALAEAAAKHQAQWLAANVLFLMPSAQKGFFPFLDEKISRPCRGVLSRA